VLAREKGWKRMLYGPGASIGSAIENAWAADSQDLPDLMAYTEPVETFKDDLFHLDAGITTTRGAVADSGAVVLWPTVQEPRLMSLVPAVHVAVLDADTIYNSLHEMMAAENWSDGMPTNALLISGPSKTADIEFTLVFGVHGPKELIVLVRK
jgi:L-lactate dehydrogenase complex protein LldG